MGTAQASSALTRYAVLGPSEDADEETETVENEDSNQAADDNAEQEQDESLQEEDASDASVTEPVDEEAPGEEASDGGANSEEVVAEVEAEVTEQSKEAEEFTGFEPKAGTGRLIEVQETSEEQEDAEAEATEETETTEPPLVEFETDQPYVLWTPPALGTYTIGVVILDSKDNELTPKRSFPVTVTEPTPVTELVWNKTRKLLEDDFIVIELRGKNIPSFDKGLFTVNFDPTTLSFKLAEPGDFFPTGYRTSIYFAQPPGIDGKVTVAIAAEEVGLPKGDGVIARVIFKVKDDVDDPSTLDISEATAPDARYILNPRQENVLPLVMTKAVFATEWVDPPEAPQQTRQGTQPGGQLPQTPTPPAGTEEKRAERPTFSGPSGVTPKGGTESTQQPASGTGSSPTELTPVDAGSQDILAPEGEPSVEEQIAMLENDKVNIQNNPNLPDDEKQQIIARIDADIARLRAGEEP